MRAAVNMTQTQKSPPPFILLEPEPNSVCGRATIPAAGNCCESYFPVVSCCFLSVYFFLVPDVFLKVEIAALFTLAVDFIQVITRDSEGEHI